MQIPIKYRDHGWALIELVNGEKLAGKILSNRRIDDLSFIALEVPEIPAEEHLPQRAGYTQLLAYPAIVCLIPVSEKAARAASRMSRDRFGDISKAQWEAFKEDDASGPSFFVNARIEGK